jgi:hypothetical protein
MRRGLWGTLILILPGGLFSIVPLPRGGIHEHAARNGDPSAPAPQRSGADPLVDRFSFGDAFADAGVFSYADPCASHAHRGPDPHPRPNEDAAPHPNARARGHAAPIPHSRAHPDARRGSFGDPPCGPPDGPGQLFPLV